MAKKLKKHKLILFISIITISLVIGIIECSKYNETYALSKYGSRGDEVKQIQQKLKNWGYYSGAVDGIYGSKTLSAVTLAKIANYFDVSVDYLLGNTEIKKEPATTTGDKLTQEILEKLAALTPENRTIALAQLDFLLDRQEKQEK